MIRRLLERRPVMISSGKEPQFANCESINGVANVHYRPKADLRKVLTFCLRVVR